MDGLCYSNSGVRPVSDQLPYKETAVSLFETIHVTAANFIT